MARSILIIEQNQADQRTLHELLGHEYTLIDATDREDGLSTLRKNFRFISAVLINVGEADNDLDILREIRSHAIFLSIPIIVTSSSDDAETKRKAFWCGANGFAAKPYDPQFLKSVIQNVMSLRENASIVNALRHDKLTGLLTREAFLQEAAKLIRWHEPGCYVLACFDIENFRLINDQYNTDTGDAVLKHVGVIIGKQM